MALQTSIETKAGALNGQLAYLDDGSTVEIYSGSQPAATTTAITDQVLLSVHDMNEVPFPVTTTATATANPVASATALATGTASFYRIRDSAGVCHRQGTVGVAGSGAELIIDNAAIVASGTVNIASYAITQG